MDYLTGTDSESVGSAVCLKLGILAVLYLHQQTENHFCSHEGKQGQSGRVNPPEGSIPAMDETNAFGFINGSVCTSQIHILLFAEVLPQSTVNQQFC